VDVVAEQFRQPAVIRDQDIQVAIVVDIAERRSPAHFLSRKRAGEGVPTSKN